MADTETAGDVTQATKEVIKAGTDVVNTVAQYMQMHAPQAFDAAAGAIQLHSIVELAMRFCIFAVLGGLLVFMAVVGSKQSDADWNRGDGFTLPIIIVGAVALIGSAVALFAIFSANLWLGAINPKAQIIYQLMEKVHK